ncbi:acyl-CoA dehydrogenase, partial [bacterium]|nr:acyl-CoA dehydrogenase [bacterium]
MLNQLLTDIRAFLDERVHPMEREFLNTPFITIKPKLELLRAEVKARGLWAPHLPTALGGRALSLTAFGQVSALLGESPIGHYLFNCQAPDIGNTELLHLHGSPEQQAQWMIPLANGDIRSCFAMTEPEFAGSNPIHMATTAVRDGNDYVINGHKWFSSSAENSAFT